MRKVTTIAASLGLIVLLMSGCQQDNPPETYEEKKKALREYRNELMNLSQNVRKLEADVTEMEAAKGMRESRKPVRLSTLQTGIFKRQIEIQGLVESDQNVILSSEVSGIAAFRTLSHKDCQSMRRVVEDGTSRICSRTVFRDISSRETLR
jgi:hypothetical protein